jgi:hypothetical protein
MKQFISVLVAAMFAAASVTAVAQEKKDDKAKAGQMDKKDATKSKTSSTKKSTTKKPKSTKSTKSGDAAKKDEMKK